jgi:ribose transport system ATP-binding protein
MMVGRTIFESAPEVPEHPSDEIVLEARGLNRGAAIRDVNFKLKKGEILGFAGLMGAGAPKSHARSLAPMCWIPAKSM